jgi:thiamine-phosphate pyrophosphorylase
VIKSYLITDRAFYEPTPQSFKNYLEGIYQNKKVDFACYRDKQSPYQKLFLETFLKVSQAQKTILHGDIELASKFGFFGVHLSSTQFDEIALSKEKNLFTIISTHTKKEAKLAQSLGADAVTFSPIFDTPNKGKPKGLEQLENLVTEVDIKVFALGGILTKQQIDSCSLIGSYGFASIRYFQSYKG